VSNPADHAETGRAIMSVVPGRAARYFKKVQCFCFRQHTLKPGELRTMRLVYFISPHIPKDIPSIIVSYAFFPVKKHT
ncbi:MAG: cytochrome c oxidase assembly protein, partial [Acidiferrobacterales bacterium]